MATFLNFTNPDTGEQKTLNVLSFQENAIEWQGEEVPSFGGTLVSTQSNPRRSWTATVEFLEPMQLDEFEEFISSGIDPFTNRPIGYRDMLISSTNGAVVQGARRGKPPAGVTVRMGSATPVDYVTPGAGMEIDRMTQRWQVDLTIREI